MSNRRHEKHGHLGADDIVIGAAGTIGVAGGDALVEELLDPGQCPMPADVGEGVGVIGGRGDVALYVEAIPQESGYIGTRHLGYNSWREQINGNYLHRDVPS